MEDLKQMAEEKSWRLNFLLTLIRRLNFCNSKWVSLWLIHNVETIASNDQNPSVPFRVFPQLSQWIWEIMESGSDQLKIHKICFKCIYSLSNDNYLKIILDYAFLAITTPEIFD